MNTLLNEITERSLGLGEAEKLGEKYQLRKSTRAILLNERGEMATQHVQNYGFHKLPGGGVDPGESLEAALRREILEEVGCGCEIISTLGVTIEYRNKYNLIHISYGYVARVVGPIGATSLDMHEQAEGQTTLWLPPPVALEKMATDVPEKYEGYFILEREKTFLRAYLAL